MTQLDGSLLEVLEAVFAGWHGVAVVGGEPSARRETLFALASRLPVGLHVVCIGSDVPALGLGEMSIQTDAELTLPAAIRSSLRMDPDALVLVEVEEDADPLVTAAAETGHLVLVSLADDGAAARTRLGAAAAAAFGSGIRLLYDLQERAIWAASPELETPRVVLRFVDNRWVPAVEDPLDGLRPPPPPQTRMPEPPSLDGVAPIPADESLLARIVRRYAPSRRTGYAPRLSPGAVGPERSKFAGRPMLGPDESWPRAPATGHPMQLVFQLRLDELPDRVRDALALEADATGWWQCFYDPSTDGKGRAWEPFSGFGLVRILPQSGARPAPEPLPAIESVERYDEAGVDGWIPIADAPNTEELEPPLEEPEQVLLDGLLWDPEAAGLLSETSERGEAFRASLTDLLAWARLSEPAELLEAAAWLHNHRGDKLLGWPAWTQGVDVPRCPKSEEPMVFLAQISANRVEDPMPGETAHFPLLFAADGTAQIFRSPVDPRLMTMIWACT